jgi:Fe-S cluster assembly protein SufD
MRILKTSARAPFMDGYSATAVPDLPSWLIAMKRRAMAAYAESFDASILNPEVARFISRGGFSERPAKPFLPSSELSSYEFFDVEAYTIVLVNGMYMPELSSEEEMPFSVYSDGFLNATKDWPDSPLKDALSVGEDILSMLNSAYMRDGAVVRVAAGEKLSRPIHIISLATPGAERSFMNPRIAIKLGEGAEASIIETVLSLEGAEYFSNRVAELFLGAGSRLFHYRYFDASPSSCEAEIAYVSMAGGADYRNFSYVRRAGVFDGRIRISMDAGAKSSVHFAAAASRESDVSYDASVRLDGSYASHESSLAAAVFDHARANLATSLSTSRGIRGAEVRQASRILLASDAARGRIMPRQSVSSEGVKAFHGAGVSGVDKEELFFLQSRGIDENAARKALSQSLLSSQFAHIADADIAGEYARMIMAENP